MKAIIFGVNGQDGFYLNKRLVSDNVEVFGVSRSGADVIGDVSDAGFVEKLITDVKPDYIFHLAANSTTKHTALLENHQTICIGAINILEAVKSHNSGIRVFLSGSALQFKNDGSPISEQTPFEAKSAYAVSRIETTYLARYYNYAFGIKVYVGFFFNHDSALRKENHVNQKIAAAVNRIAQGSSERLVLGNINVRKEFNYAGDIVNAIWLLVNQDSVFEAVIGSGKAYSIEEWLSCCFTKTGRNWQEYVDIDDTFVPEYQVLVSKPDRITGLGWRPEIGFEQLSDIMMYNLI